MLTYKIIQKLEDVSSDWEKLITDSETATVFQTRGYLQAWTESFIDPAEIFLFEAYENDHLVAVAPFRKRGGKLTFLGTDRLSSDDLVTDFGDLVIKKNYERKVWESLFEFFPTQGIEDMELDYLREKSPSLAVLRDKKYSVEKILDNSMPDVAPAMNLPVTWEDHLLQLDRKSRHELRRKFRRLDEVNYRFEEVSNLQQAMPEFFRLHKVSTEQKDHFMTPLMEKFFATMTAYLADQGFIHIMLLKIEEQNISVTIAFLWKKEYWLYNSGFDRHYIDLSVGVLLKAQTVKWAIENGFKKYNFLRGPERYKYELGAKDEALFKVRIKF